MLYFQSIQDHSWRRHHGAGVCAFGGEPEGESADRTGLGIVEIVPAKLANTAGMMGAVSLAEKLLA